MKTLLKKIALVGVALIGLASTASAQLTASSANAIPFFSIDGATGTFTTDSSQVARPVLGFMGSAMNEGMVLFLLTIAFGITVYIVKRFSKARA